MVIRFVIALIGIAVVIVGLFACGLTWAAQTMRDAHEDAQDGFTD